MQNTGSCLISCSHTKAMCWPLNTLQLYQDHYHDKQTSIIITSKHISWWMPFNIYFCPSVINNDHSHLLDNWSYAERKHCDLCCAHSYLVNFNAKISSEMLSLKQSSIVEICSGKLRANTQASQEPDSKQVQCQRAHRSELMTSNDGQYSEFETINNMNSLTTRGFGQFEKFMNWKRAFKDNPQVCTNVDTYLLLQWGNLGVNATL